MTADPRENAAPPAPPADAEGSPVDEAPPPVRTSPDRRLPDSGAALPTVPPKRRGRRLVAWLAAMVLVLSLGILAAALTHEAQQSAVRAGQHELVSRLAMLSQRLSRQAREAVAGAEGAFVGMEDSRAAIDGILAALERGDAGGEIAAVAARSRPLLDDLREAWQPMRADVDRLLMSRAAVLGTRAGREKVNELAPLLLAQSDEVVEVMVREDGDRALINLAGRQRTLTQRIRAAVNEIALGEAGAEVAAAQCGRDIRLYGRTVSLLEGRVAARAAAEFDGLKATYQELAAQVDAVLGIVGEFLAARGAAEAIGLESDRFLEITQQLGGSIDAEIVSPLVSRHLPEGIDAARLLRWLPSAAAALAALALLVLVRVVVGGARADARMQAAVVQGQSAAVSALESVLRRLADGDLGARADSADPVTGAVAASINELGEKVRSLVVRVDALAGELSAETGACRDAARGLARSAERQLGELDAAADEVRLTARTIGDLAASAGSAREAAGAARDAAGLAAGSIRQTIEDVNEALEEIRQVQEHLQQLAANARRIEQNATSMYEFAEQVRVLSMNASIRAAAATEPGRGMVAAMDELQGLSRRCGESAGGVIELIVALGRDAVDASTAIDRLVARWQDDAALSQAAGRALDDVQASAGGMSSLADDAGGKARTCSETVQAAAARMSEVRLATSEAVQCMQRAAGSIDRLERAAHELDESISAFRT